MAPYSMDWIALAVFWDIIKMNLIPIPTSTPIIHINSYMEMVEFRYWMTIEVLESGGE
jgi:hypothetical protein